MNLSETAFATLDNTNGSFEKEMKFSLRWFTPSHEVDLCGHVIFLKLLDLFTLLVSITNWYSVCRPHLQLQL